MDGEIQIIPDNNSALNVDESIKSRLWKAIDINGNLVAPLSPDTYKYDGVNPGVNTEKVVMVKGGSRLSTKIENIQYTGKMTPESDYGYTFNMFYDTLASVPPHILLKEL